ncbi:MAG: DUF2147 domain-containing protein [Flavobacteriales bacterium]|nr:DUF2147 domain-containing protein [Flavobacteriales bacterium]
MKKVITHIMIAFAMAGSVQAQTTSAKDKILGEWFNVDKTGIIEIYKKENKYYGIIVRGTDKSPTKFDIHNPDPKKQNQLLVGKHILNDFTYDDGEWEDGTIYNPRNGNTYSCVMVMIDNNVLKITGYIGITLFGKTQLWTRVVE